LTLLLRISQGRIKDHVVLKKLVCLEMLIFLYFENFIFFGIFELFEKIASHDASNQTDTQKLKEETNFDIFKN